MTFILVYSSGLLHSLTQNQQERRYILSIDRGQSMLLCLYEEQHKTVFEKHILSCLVN
jgi:hypothetical protein